MEKREHLLLMISLLLKGDALTTAYPLFFLTARDTADDLPGL